MIPCGKNTGDRVRKRGMKHVKSMMTGGVMAGVRSFCLRSAGGEMERLAGNLDMIFACREPPSLITAIFRSIITWIKDQHTAQEPYMYNESI